MMIRVMYRDGRFDIVKHSTLDGLLEKQSVTSFKRSNGWVVVGLDDVRSSSRSSYHGTERRQL